MKVYGLSKALVSETFNFVILIMVVLKTKTKTIPSKNNGRMEGRTKKIYGELSFPCIGVWDGFHVHVATRLKVSILSSISITLVTWI